MRDSDFTILLVEDNKHDVRFVLRAWDKNKITNPIEIVSNGQECLDYLHQVGKFNGKPRPGLILMDIRMPIMDGIEALKHIRSEDSFRHIPVVMLTTSEEDTDLVRSYDLGCNSFVQKPVEFTGLAEAVKTIHLFWTLSKTP